MDSWYRRGVSTELKWTRRWERFRREDFDLPLGFPVWRKHWGQRLANAKREPIELRMRVKPGSERPRDFTLQPKKFVLPGSRMGVAIFT
jgi:hypothetical protein